MKHGILILAVLASLSGCTKHLNIIRSGQTDHQWRPGEGLLLMRILTNAPLSELQITGETSGKIEGSDLKNMAFLLIALPAGKYSFTRVEYELGKKFWYYTRWETPRAYFLLETSDSTSWDFEIHPQRINYVGDFVADIDNYTRRGLIYLVNRSSFALKYMLNRNSDLVHKYSMRYAGFGKDRFFDYITGHNAQ